MIPEPVLKMKHFAIQKHFQIPLCFSRALWAGCQGPLGAGGCLQRALWVNPAWEPEHNQVRRGSFQLSGESGSLCPGQKLNLRLRNNIYKGETESICFCRINSCIIQSYELFRVFVSPLSLAALLFHVAQFIPCRKQTR